MLAQLRPALQISLHGNIAQRLHTYIPYMLCLYVCTCSVSIAILHLIDYTIVGGMLAFYHISSTTFMCSLVQKYKSVDIIMHSRPIHEWIKFQSFDVCIGNSVKLKHQDVSEKLKTSYILLPQRCNNKCSLYSRTASIQKIMSTSHFCGLFQSVFFGAGTLFE